MSPASSCLFACCWCAPQLIADVRDQLQLNRKAAVFNGKRYGCVYSLKQDLQPFRSPSITTCQTVFVASQGPTAAPYQQIAREIKPARERLRHALLAGLPVTALDALFWFGSQRVAADIAQLRRSGMGIVTEEVEVSDNLFNTTRRVPVYRLTSK
jgi:hypothetical protein